MLLLVPPLDDAGEWPTLGPQVCAFIEAKCVHGPGDILGRPAKLDDEQRAIIYSLYEVHPPGSPRAGRRRFNRAGLSMRRGRAKTELGSWIGCAELHPDGPVRCDGFDAYGNPVGAPVVSPLLLLFAASEEQAGDTAFEAITQAIINGPLADELYVTGEQISRLDGKGRAKTLAGAPSSNEGRLASWAWFEETHRATRPALKEGHKVVRDGFPKRAAGDPWSLETTTAFRPGLESIAEATFDYAQQISDGHLPAGGLFFIHRQAGDEHDLKTREGLTAAVIEATGPAALPWTDVERIVDQWDEPDADRERLEQVWLNRPTHSASQAFHVPTWDERADETKAIPPRALVTAGFDGSRSRDGTALVITDVKTGRQELVGLWERPPDTEQWTVPADLVDAAVDAIFDRFTVWRLYADPWKWRDELNRWAGRHGEEHVVEWGTHRAQKMAYVVQRYRRAIASGELSHDGDDDFRRHIANAQRINVPSLFDEDGEQMFLIGKARSDSPLKMDAAVAAALAWEARGDAIASGAKGGRKHRNASDYRISRL